jgi:hypothetical protein
MNQFVGLIQSVIDSYPFLNYGLQTSGRFHQHVFEQLLRVQIPKAKKDSEVISVFLRFWNLCAQKLLVKCWRN